MKLKMLLLKILDIIVYDLLMLLLCQTHTKQVFVYLVCKQMRRLYKNNIIKNYIHSQRNSNAWAEKYQGGMWLHYAVSKLTV